MADADIYEFGDMVGRRDAEGVWTVTFRSTGRLLGQIRQTSDGYTAHHAGFGGGAGPDQTLDDAFRTLWELD